MFKIRSISNNLNTHACIKNPEINSKNCIETKKCTDVKFGGTDEKCGKLLPSLIGTTCIKDPLNEVCKETDLCNEAKYVNSFYKCPLLKVSDPNIKYCEFYSNNNGCKEKIINCEQKTDDATEEICGKLETNDNKKKCIKNKDGNNCILINYCNYSEGTSNDECGKLPVENIENICVKKNGEIKCEEIKKVEETEKASEIREDKTNEEEKTNEEDKKQEEDKTHEDDKTDEGVKNEGKIKKDDEDKKEEAKKDNEDKTEEDKTEDKTEAYKIEEDKNDSYLFSLSFEIVILLFIIL